MIYADSGINWIFPYAVEYEDELIIILKELPREHKGALQSKVDKWVTLNPDATVWIDGARKLVEIKSTTSTRWTPLIK